MGLQYDFNRNIINFSLPGQRAHLPERDEGAPRHLLLRGHQRGRPGRQEERGRRGRVQAVHHHSEEETRAGLAVRHGPRVQDRGVSTAGHQMVGHVKRTMIGTYHDWESLGSLYSSLVSS